MTELDPKTGANTGFRRVLEDVLNKIDREELVHLARELIRIPSVYRPEEPDGNEARVARFVATYLERAGFEVKTEEVAPGRPRAK
jgi:succinyl-diaminopimelate desuccinylase